MLTKTILVAMLSFATVNLAQANEVIELNESNTATLRGPIDDRMVQSVLLETQQVASKRKSTSQPIYLAVDSPGGSIDAGNMLNSNLKAIKNLKTLSIFAASMASAIVQAQPGERLGIENSILMFHRAAGGVEGIFETGNLESRLDFYKRIVRSMEQTNADRMKISLAQYKDYVREELWMYGNENIQRNALDRTVTVKCSNSLIKATSKIKVNTFIGPLTLVFSKCPLLTYPVAITGGEDAQAKFLKAYPEISKKFSFGYRIR